jgi:drug/metabolite transporter (DMT)-like permease
MDLMARLLKFPWGPTILSSSVAVVVGVAIVVFEAPPALLILAAWATSAIYAVLSSRIDRRPEGR